MSGLQIFNAHPALYASDASTFAHPVLSIYSDTDAAGRTVGKLQIGSIVLTTTGLLGWTGDGMGGEEQRAFPPWATIPAYRDLADGRRWHIFFTMGAQSVRAVHAAWAFKLIPTKTEIRRVEALKEHALPWKVKATVHYNPLQKIAYFSVVFGLVPLAIISGLALSPSLDAWAPWVPRLWRPSIRAHLAFRRDVRHHRLLRRPLHDGRADRFGTTCAR